MDYRRNEDKLGCAPRSYNAWIDISITEGAVTEPVTLQDVKDHARITGTDDDTYLTSLIKSARIMLEKYTATSLVEKSIVFHAKNGYGGIELPYGPVTAITGFFNSEDVAVTDYVTSGIDFLKIDKPASDFINVEYTAGYTTVPEDLKTAIKKQVAYDYEHRGDQNDETGLCPAAKATAKPYRRLTWLL